MSPIQGWHVSERVLPEPWLCAEMRFHTLQASFLSTKEASILLFEEELPHFSLELVLQTAGRSGWDMAGVGVQSLTLFCPLVPGWFTDQGGVPSFSSPS